MSEIYRLFGEDDHDWSEEAALEAFQNETLGKGNHNVRLFHADRKPNGFVVGKHWSDVQLKMWRVGLKEGTLGIEELYEDGKYPFWWLDNHFPGSLDWYEGYRGLKEKYLRLVDGP